MLGKRARDNEIGSHFLTKDWAIQKNNNHMAKDEESKLEPQKIKSPEL